MEDDDLNSVLQAETLEGEAVALKEDPTDSTEKTEETTETSKVDDKPEPTSEQDADKSEEPDKTSDRISKLEAELAEEQKQRKAFQARAKDERGKRQDAEKRPEFWNDPEKALDHIDKTVDQKITDVKINLSRAQARRQHADYDAKEEKFSEMCQGTPSLVQQMLDSDDPAGFAYQTVADADKIAEIGDLDAWKQQEREKMKQELLADLKKDGEETLKKAEALPGSMDVTDARDGAQVVEALSLDDILESKAS